jgi:pyruvate/2-oxoacid:ferredoxin oxidoreductase alpha subunit
MVETRERVKICDGNRAGAYGVLLAKPDVIAVYPITPQTSLIEHLTEWKADGILNAEIVEVEGEISSMATAIGTSAAGGRAFTATSSMGLNFMFDTYQMAALARLPIVMVNATREQIPPSVVAAGDQDIMGVIETGWIHIHTETCQEILDSIIMAYRLAEDPEILVPVTIAYDGFYLSYLTEAVELPPEDEVDRFLPRRPRPKIGFEPPLSFGFGDGTARGVAEARYRHQAAMERAKERVDEIDQEFKSIFGRGYGGQIEEYRTDDAEIVLVSLGSCTGTARVAIDRKREQGIKAGLIKLRAFRPFPSERIAGVLRNKKAVGAIDRSVALGWNCGHIFRELLTSLYGSGISLPMADFIDGLGGGDITIDHIERIIDDTYAASHGKPFEKVTWLQVG